jgi:recombination protein RecT
MTGKDIERAGQPSVKQLIQQMTPEIKKALPAHLDADRIARIAMTLISTNRALAECTPESFLGALMTASQLGLEPGPLGEAYLVPYGKQVTFIPGYRGLIKLAYQSGMVKRIGAHIVHENDAFDYSLGTHPTLKHRPDMLKPGRAIGVYAVATLASGETPFVVLAVDEIEAIRRRSRAAKNGPWVTDWDAMARKTAVRQLARWLPLSPDLRDFTLAAGLDGSTRTQVESTRPDLDPIEIPNDPLELEPAAAPVTAEEIRAGAASARRPAHAEPDRPAEDVVPGPVDEAPMARVWHEQGHPNELGHDRHVWVPEGCDLCPGRESAEGEPLATHYYGHTKDWVDGCGPCEQEQAWKAEDDQSGPT